MSELEALMLGLVFLNYLLIKSWLKDEHARKLKLLAELRKGATYERV